MKHRILRGDVLSIVSIASLAARLHADFRVLYDHRGEDDFHIEDTTVTDREERVIIGQRKAIDDGYVVGGVVTTATAGLRRGQVFVSAYVRAAGGSGAVRSMLLGDYIFDGHPIPLDRVMDPGPSGGEGNFNLLAIASDVVPVDISRSLGVVNTIRKIHGFAWWYNAAAVVATRTMVASLVEPLDAGPSGFAGPATVWASATITLTTGEEGLMFVKEGFSSYNDNGTITYANTTTAPNPFPLWVRSTDTMDLFLDVTNPDAGDRHSIYVLFEEWLVVAD